MKQGLELMVAGIGTVFFFLTLMVVIMYGAAAIIRKFGKPEPPSGVKRSSSPGKNERVEVAVAVATASMTVNAPLPGLVVRTIAAEGSTVAKDDVLMIIEAMKMEIEVKSPSAGKVTRIAVKKGEQLTAGQLLVQLN